MAHDAAAPPPVASPPPADTRPPPLEGQWFQRWEVEGGGEVFATVPVGIREKRPVLVGVHGAGDRADWSCSEWFATTAGWPLVVCPKGVPSKWHGFQAWASAEQLASRADRAIEELRRRYGAYVEDGPAIFAGWSQGGTLASQVVASRPGVYDTAVLVEVGHTPLDPGGVVANLEKGGVKRLLVSCSSGPCRAFSRRVESVAKRRGMPFASNDVGNRGHTFDEPVFRTLGPALASLVKDEPRWAGLEAAVSAKWLQNTSDGGPP